MASLKVRLISKKLVRPLFSTPLSLRNYKLSLIDQLMNNRYMPIAFFYPNHQHRKHSNNTSEISSLLEESLSKTLSSYYPFAGRLTDNISVNCNDMGATFLEARFGSPMSDILNGVNASAQDIVFPRGLPWSSGHDQSSLVVAQLSHFDCGGKALSVCLSHKIGDGNTLCNFIDDWAAMARQSIDKPSPRFTGTSIFPPIKISSNKPAFNMKEGQQCVSKRYVFDSDKLNKLKAKATIESGLNKPTRVEVVSALLHKCAMSASMSSFGSFKPSVLTSVMNLRPLLGLATTQNYVGNITSRFFVSTNDEKEMNFPTLVSKIRSAKVQHYEKYKGINTSDIISATLEEAEQLKVLQDEDDIDGYTCSSLCRYPTYDIDFGWGRPIRVSLANSPCNNHLVLMDNGNADGIEALVNLDEQVMSAFQRDPELLEFASTLCVKEL